MIYFDATKYLNKPDLRPNIHPCVCETHVNANETVEQAVLRWAKTAYDQRALCCFDFEEELDFSKPYSPRIDTVFDQWSGWFDVAKKAYPTIRIGNYDLPWHERGDTSIDDLKGTRHHRGVNDRLDFAAPQVYIDHVIDMKAWEKWAMTKIVSARRWNKDVYCFLNPTHFNHPVYDKVADKKLEHAVKFLNKEADGIIWWGGWGWNSWPDGGGHMVWYEFNPKDAWVQLSK